MNTLFDENAACHIALGQAYGSCLKDGDSLTPEQLAARGANTSLIHVDWMIGSNRIDIDGIGAARRLGAGDARRRVGLVSNRWRGAPTSRCVPWARPRHPHGSSRWGSAPPGPRRPGPC